MTYNEKQEFKKKIGLLKNWSDNYKKLNEVSDAFRFLFNADSESKALSPMWDMFNSYTNLVAKQLGDEDDWVTWFAWENDFGVRGHEAKASNWRKARNIVTIYDLFDLIENKYE